MPPIDANRRPYIEDSGASAAVLAWPTTITGIASAQTIAGAFNIDTTFTGFMRGIGGTPADGNGNIARGIARQCASRGFTPRTSPCAVEARQSRQIHGLRLSAVVI
jgi:hypothetical protein